MPDTVKPATPFDQHRFHLLDALRGIAALLVVPRHTPNNFHHAFFLFSTFLAVDFFFCLSGFVVAYSYEQRLRTTLRFRTFVLTRAIRLYPLAVLGTIVGAIVALLYPGHSAFTGLAPHSIVLTIVYGVLVLPLPGGVLFPLDTTLWTLALELLANVSYGLLLRLRLASTTVFLSIVALALAGLTVAAVRSGDLDLGYAAGNFFIGLLRVTVSFFAGVLLCRLYRARKPVRFHGRRALFPALVLTVTFTFLLAHPFSVGHTIMAELLMIALVFPLIIYLGARLELPGPWNTLCSFLGTISYPLYILHQPLLSTLRSLNLASPRAVVLFALALLTLISWLASELFDVPVRRALTRRFRKPTLVPQTQI